MVPIERSVRFSARLATAARHVACPAGQPELYNRLKDELQAIPGSDNLSVSLYRWQGQERVIVARKNCAGRELFYFVLPGDDPSGEGHPASGKRFRLDARLKDTIVALVKGCADGTKKPGRSEGIDLTG